MILSDGRGWFDVWVAQHLSVSLTAARGLSLVEFVSALGGEHQALDMTLDQADSEGSAVIRVAEHGDWCWGVEHFTSRGSEPSVISRLSASDMAVVLSCTQTISTFVYAASGSLRSGFDLLAPQFRFGEEPDRLEKVWPTAETVTSRGALRPSDALELLELITGFIVSPEFLEGPLDSVRA